MKVIVEYTRRKIVPYILPKGYAGFISKEYRFSEENNFKCEMEADDAQRYCDGEVFRIVSALSKASLSNNGEEDDIFQEKVTLDADADEPETMAGVEGTNDEAQPHSKDELIAKLMAGLDGLDEGQIRDYVKAEDLFKGLILAGPAKRGSMLTKIRAFLQDKAW